jgi:rhomboid family protein
MAMTTRWHRLHRAGADYLAAAPGTYILLLILAVTTLVLRGVDAPTTTRILRHQSTNLFQMSRDAPRVLVLSAFLLDNGRLLAQAIQFTIVLAPVERWIGTYRWLATFAAGHVGATLATTVGIWLQVREGAGRSLIYPVDVGASYGVAAAAGVLVYRLRRPWMVVWLGFVAVYLGRPVITSGTFTDWGHLIAFGIGLAMGPLVRPDRTNRRHGLLVVGAGLLAGAAGCGVLLFTVPDREIAVPRAGPTVEATVVGRPADCPAGCRGVVVRYSANGQPQTGILVLRQQTLMQRGDRVLAVLDPATPGRLRALRPPQRVSPDSLFGAMAAAGAVTGTALLVLASRNPGQADGVVAVDLVPVLFGPDRPSPEAADHHHQLEGPPQQTQQRSQRHQRPPLAVGGHRQGGHGQVGGDRNRQHASGQAELAGEDEEEQPEVGEGTECREDH